MNKWMWLVRTFIAFNKGGQVLNAFHLLLKLTLIPPYANALRDLNKSCNWRLCFIELILKLQLIKQKLKIIWTFPIEIKFSLEALNKKSQIAVGLHKH